MRTRESTATEIERAAANILKAVNKAIAGGLTKTELARRIGITPQTLNNRLARPGKFEIDELRELELALDIDIPGNLHTRTAA